MKKNYITSLKGIACLLVAIGHFLGTIKYAESISVDTSFFSLLKSCRMDFLISESFWLYLFFIVSGYLVAHSKVSKLPELFVRGFVRFLRLALPILCACLLIFVFSQIIPFYNDDTKLLFENEWLQSSYSQPLGILGAVLSPIYVLVLGNSVFNFPYWVLRSMFLASLLVYLVTYISSKIKSKYLKIAFIISVAFVAFFLDKIVFSCIVGAILFYYEECLQFLFKSWISVCVIGVLSFVLCFINALYGAILLFSWLLITMVRFEKLQKALEVKPLVYLGEISFGIYSFHWPIFCSLGSLLIIKLWNAVGGGLAVFIATLAVIVITVVLSIFYHYAMEKPSSLLVEWIKNKFIAGPAKKKV